MEHPPVASDDFMEAKRMHTDNQQADEKLVTYEEDLQKVLIEIWSEPEKHDKSLLRNILRQACDDLVNAGEARKSAFKEVTLRIFESHVTTLMRSCKERLLELSDKEDLALTPEVFKSCLSVPRSLVWTYDCTLGEAFTMLDLQYEMILNKIADKTLLDDQSVRPVLFRFVVACRCFLETSSKGRMRFKAVWGHAKITGEVLECLFDSGLDEQKADLIRALVFDNRLGYMLSQDRIHHILKTNNVGCEMIYYILSNEVFRNECIQRLRAERRVEPFEDEESDVKPPDVEFDDSQYLDYKPGVRRAWHPFHYLFTFETDEYNFNPEERAAARDFVPSLIDALSEVKAQYKKVSFPRCGNGWNSFGPWTVVSVRKQRLTDVVKGILGCQTSDIARIGFRYAAVLGIQRRQAGPSRVLRSALPREILMRLEQMVFKNSEMKGEDTLLSSGDDEASDIDE